MGKKTVFSEEQKKDIIDLYSNQSITLTKIALKYGCGRGTIVRLLQEENIKLRQQNVGDGCRKIKNQDIIDMIELYRSGCTCREIGDKYGVSYSRVNQIMRANNIERTDTKIKKCQYADVVQMYNDGYTSRQIAQKYNCCQGVVSKILRRCGAEMRTSSQYNRKYYFNDHYFDNIDTHNKAYILGFLYADGCNHSSRRTVSLKLQERDKEILERINKEIENEKPLVFVDLKQQNNNWQNAYEITLCSRYLSDVLADKGVVPRKSLVITYPEWLDRDLFPDFIRGYIDGDGCISKDIHHTGVYITGTQSFCESLGKIFEDTLGITSYHINIPSRAKENDTTTRVIQINGLSDVKKLLDWIYKDAELYLQRKYDIYKSIYCNNTK